MTKITYRDGVAILQVCGYTPALVGGLFLCLRHGFAKSSGWVFLITLAILRMIGSICELISIDHPSKGVTTTAFICISIGLSPLTLLCMGCLGRVNAHVPRPVPSMLAKIVSLVSLVGVSLGIFGGIKAGRSDDPTKISIESKIAVLIFTAVYLSVLLYFFLLLAQATHVQHGERRLMLAVCLSLPLIAVRLVYALVADFANDHAFSYFSGGSTTIYLCMAVLEELVVVYLCIAIGLTVKKLATTNEPMRKSSDQENVIEYANYGGNYPGQTYTGPGRNQYMHTTTQNTTSQPVPPSYNNRAQGNNPDYTPRPKRKANGPVTWLYATAMNAYDERKH